MLLAKYSATAHMNMSFSFLLSASLEQSMEDDSVESEEERK